MKLDNPTRSVQINFRVTTEDYAVLARLATANSMAPSALARETLLNILELLPASAESKTP